jgi:hypothetical protein
VNNVESVSTDGIKAFQWACTVRSGLYEAQFFEAPSKAIL